MCTPSCGSFVRRDACSTLTLFSRQERRQVLARQRLQRNGSQLDGRATLRRPQAYRPMKFERPIRNDRADLVTPVRARPHGFGALWRGHLFLFDKAPSRPTFGADAGDRLLWTVVGLEALRLVLRFLAFPFPPFWLAVPVYLGLALLSIRVIAGLPWSAIGFPRGLRGTRLRNRSLSKCS